MASDIDPSKPAGPVAYTAGVRANFASTKIEIEALQQALGELEDGGPYLSLDGGVMGGVLTLVGDPSDMADASTKNYVDVTTANLIPSSANIVAGLGFTPYDAANPASYQTDVQVTATVNLAIAGYVPLAQRGAANGVATLDATGVVPTTQLPGAVTGTISYQGAWNAATNTPTLASGALAGGVTQPKGNYYVVSVGATTAAIDGVTTWVAGDWILSNGAIWQRVQNSTSPYLPLSGGTISGALNLSLLNIAGADLSKALTATPDDAGPADIRFADEFGNTAVIIDADGTIEAGNFVADRATIASLTATSFAQSAVQMPNTILYEIADGANDIIVQDDFGFAALIVDASGLVEAQKLTVDTITANTVTAPGGSALTGSALLLDQFAITEAADGLNDVLFVDEFGFAALGILGIDGSVLGGGGGGSGGGGGDDPNTYYPSLLTARDALATALSMTVRDNTASKVASPIWTYNHVVGYGQSLNLGTAGSPRISIAEGLDNLCLGSRPAGTQGSGSSTFNPATNAGFNPLDGTLGNEVPSIAATNQWRKLQLRWRGLASDATRRLVVNACGEGGQSIEQLSKGATPNLYGQIGSLITQAQAAAAAAGGTYGVVAVYYIQGENNYAANSYDHTQAGYLAKWEQLRSDIAADIMALTGQEFPPAFVTVQTSSQWDGTGDTTAIGNAQLQAVLTAPLGDYMAAPYYAVPDNGPGNGHLTNDGYRWIGNATGRVLHKLMDRGEGWLPLYVTRASYRGSQILLECHTPEPPLQIQPAYTGIDASTLTTYADLGFRSGDDLSNFAILSVQVLNSTILLTVNRAVDATLHPWIQYGDKTNHGGNGNICDSDPFQSLDPFSTGGAYPMWNWLAQFRMSIVSDV